MGELSAESFADWLHPSDVIEHYHQRGEREPEAYVIALLCDGILQAAAGQLIINSRDFGLALIPRELWPLAAKTDVWITGRFRLSGRKPGGEQTAISAYDVRVDRDIRTLPEQPPHKPVASPRPPKAGRPPAPWWDELWIEIARQLYVGDLKPDSQAAIEKAMHRWISASGHEAGETAVRDRARRLFRALNREVGNSGN